MLSDSPVAHGEAHSLPLLVGQHGTPASAFMAGLGIHFTFTHLVHTNTLASYSRLILRRQEVNFYPDSVDLTKYELSTSSLATLLKVILPVTGVNFHKWAANGHLGSTCMQKCMYTYFSWIVHNSSKPQVWIVLTLILKGVWPSICI